jgi:carbon-monoxide dehydrogenase small subunit
MRLEFKVNGRAAEVDVPPMKRLIDVLREELRLTGTKEGCGEGECGSCTVLLAGEPVNACLVIASQLQAKEVITVEGLAADDRLTPLQQCFIEGGGAQCGICTPGMLISARYLLDRTLEPSDEETRTAIAGNLCRCTGYQRIVESILQAAAVERQRQEVPAPEPIHEAAERERHRPGAANP